MKNIIILFILVLYGCNPNDTCHCTETVTNVRNNLVDINDYIIECDGPYTILETYEWGNVVTDCR